MVITFCGHGRVSEPEKVREWLSQVMDQFIHEEVLTFYLGGYGEFDQMAASVIQEKKKWNLKAQSVLVIPYLNRKYDEELYDYTLYPLIHLWRLFLPNMPYRDETNGWCLRPMWSLPM